MKKHILLQNATRRKYDEAPELPKGATYDERQGFWKIGNKPIVLIDDFRNSRTSKKCDQETGEDQKGE